MVVSASSFMLLKAKNATLVSLTAILSLLIQQVYYAIKGIQGFLSLTDALLLSLSLIAVGLVSWLVSQRIAVSEIKEWEKNQEIKQLRQINEQVIKNIPNGLIVFDDDNEIVLINSAGVKMLRLNFSPNESDLSKNFAVLNYIASFDKHFIEWYQSKDSRIFYFLKIPQNDTHPEYTLKISKISLKGHGTMLTMVDESDSESRAQKLKLESLGQLSASIAHEIKNPLSSICQASQLLKEFSDKDNPTYELVDIIDSQTQRVTRIIDDIVRLSKQEPPAQELIHLKTWLPNFVRQYYLGKSVGLYFRTDHSVMFDPHHLEQIMTNLLNNALRHTKVVENLPDVQVLIHANDENLYIDVIDHGDGVPKDYLPKLFTPFFTKSLGGTGLGLYLSKAFSEANHARLMYLPNYKKSCFRLIMPIEKHVLEWFYFYNISKYLQKVSIFSQTPCFFCWFSFIMTFFGVLTFANTQQTHGFLFY